MDVRAISRNVGVALLFVAAFMLLSAVVAALDSVDSSFYPLLLSGILTFCCGIFPLVFVPRRHAEINTREGVLIILLRFQDDGKRNVYAQSIVCLTSVLVWIALFECSRDPVQIYSFTRGFAIGIPPFAGRHKKEKRRTG